MQRPHQAARDVEQWATTEGFGAVRLHARDRVVVPALTPLSVHVHVHVCVCVCACVCVCVCVCVGVRSELAATPLTTVRSSFLSSSTACSSFAPYARAASSLPPRAHATTVRASSVLGHIVGPGGDVVRFACVLVVR